MKKLRFLGVIVIIICISSCTSTKPSASSPKPTTSGLKPPMSIKIGDIKNYEYIFITPTNSLTSSSGYVIGGQYYSSSKSVNPSDVISGILTKDGFIRLPELKPEFIDQTLIVNYGESGKRNIAGGLFGYTIEVTIQFISAKSHTLICSCTAEGQGSTEADDIRQAITRCLSSLLSKEN